MSAITGIIESKKILTEIDYEEIQFDMLKRGSFFKQIISIDCSFQFFNVLNNNQKGEINLYENENFAINFDGRIDNKDELSASLGLNPKISNAQLVLKGLDQWGIHVLNKIVGPFSLCLFNKINKEIICATDHLSMRPFYYSLNRDRFIYGTEPKYLHKSFLLKKVLNKNKIKSSILRNELHHDESFFENIKKLPRGCFIKISGGSIEETEYFKFNEPDYIQLNSEEEYIEMFHDTFEKVINSLIFSNGKIGSNLSGGLDSSSVSRMISHLNSKRKNSLELFCYSYYFSQLDPIDEEKTNELEYVKDVVSLGGCKSRIVEIKRGDYLSKLFDDQHMFPQPCVHGNRYQELALIKDCKKDGVDTILTGFDGDCTIGYGLEKIQDYFDKNQIFRALKENRKYRKKFKLKDNTLQVLGMYFFIKNLPISVHLNYKKLKGLSNFDVHHKFINSDLRFNFNYKELLQEKRELMFNSNKGHQRLLNNKNFSNILEMLDIDYSYNGIEERHPFCDKRLMNLCLNIPPSMKFKNGYTRYILRKAMERHLPKSVSNRITKADMSSYFFYNADSSIKRIIDELIQSNTEVKDFLDLKSLKYFYSKTNRLSLEEKTLLVYYNVTNNWILQNFS